MAKCPLFVSPYEKVTRERECKQLRSRIVTSWLWMCAFTVNGQWRCPHFITQGGKSLIILCPLLPWIMTTHSWYHKCSPLFGMNCLTLRKTVSSFKGNVGTYCFSQLMKICLTWSFHLGSLVLFAHYLPPTPAVYISNDRILPVWMFFIVKRLGAV